MTTDLAKLVEDLRDMANTLKSIGYDGLDGIATEAADAIEALQSTPSQGIAEAMHHLGRVLYYISDLHPDDRCRALDEALAFYNGNNPDAKVEPSDIAMQRLTTEPNPPTISPDDAAGVRYRTAPMQVRGAGVGDGEED